MHTTKTQQAMLRFLMEQSDLLVILTTPDGLIRDCNRGFLHSTGLSEKPLQRPLGDFMTLPDGFPDGTNPDSTQLFHLHGIRMPFLVQVFATADGCLLVGEKRIIEDEGILEAISRTNRDLSDVIRQAKRQNLALQQANEEITRLMNTDLLTNLPNRRHFFSRTEPLFEQAREQDGQPLAILLMDLDHFKRINDRCGHPAGDQVLKSFGQILLQTARDEDLPARFGGEEFILALPGIRLPEVVRLGETIRRRMERTTWPSIPEPVTCSLGLSLLHHRDGSLNDLISRADQALYLAKNHGRNRLRFLLPDQTARTNRTEISRVRRGYRPPLRGKHRPL